jgi:hypothetical protein
MKADALFQWTIKLAQLFTLEIVDELLLRGDYPHHTKIN